MDSPQLVDLNKNPGVGWHEDFIVHLASIVRPRVYVELGIDQCVLFNRIIPYAQLLIGVDINRDAVNFIDKTANTIFVHSTTQDYARQLQAENMKIDMLFIDADHSREAVLQDFYSYLPFVAPHGLILLHDVHPGNEGFIVPTLCGTAYLAAEELSHRSDEYEIMTIPVSPGLAICRKRNSQLSWQESQEGAST